MHSSFLIFSWRSILFHPNIFSDWSIKTTLFCIYLYTESPCHLCFIISFLQAKFLVNKSQILTDMQVNSTLNRKSLINGEILIRLFGLSGICLPHIQLLIFCLGSNFNELVHCLLWWNILLPAISPLIFQIFNISPSPHPQTKDYSMDLSWICVILLLQ